ncbi:MAG: hypothetical protein IJ173_01315 [Kiritimatiellae bacterium]|nr:hypothetical protein [Kiritimatiellia bacterium]
MMTKRKIPVLAAGIALALCLAAVFGGSCLPYDPAGAGGDESFLECCAVCCVVAGVMFLPVASVCFAKRLFAGRRFRFILSWLVGFLIPWLLLVYETYFPQVPPEGSYCTEVEQCFQFAIFIAIITGVVNAVDSLVERLLCKLSTQRKDPSNENEVSINA